jgi:hypothetical protein
MLASETSDFKTVCYAPFRSSHVLNRVAEREALRWVQKYITVFGKLIPY